MALTQKGASYPYRDKIKDDWVRSIHDDHASKIQAILTQGNFGAEGVPQLPSGPTALNVTAVNGIFTATIAHKNAPSGVRYRLQWSGSPSFPPGGIVEEELSAASFGGATWQKSLPGQKLYFRAAAKFPASEMTPWVYMGSSAQPTRIG